MLIKTGSHVETDEFGTQLVVQDYTWDDSDGAAGVLRTGPISGSVQLADGTVYDVSPDVIDHAPGHAQAIAYQIAKVHERTGRLTFLLHGDRYDGDCRVAVVGDENEFEWAHSAGCDQATG